MALIDVSVPLRPGMTVWPGDRETTIDRSASIAAGDLFNLSALALSAHAGTHVDAPAHFVEGAPGVESISLESLVGPALVVATNAESRIDEAELGRLRIPPATKRVLFKTSNSALWGSKSFEPDHVQLDGSAARAIVARGVRLVGIDYLSIGDEDVHRVLLGAGVVPLEGLDLRRVEPGRYRLICLPLLPGADGAPARALLEQLEA